MMLALSCSAIAHMSANKNAMGKKRTPWIKPVRATTKSTGISKSKSSSILAV